MTNLYEKILKDIKKLEAKAGGDRVKYKQALSARLKLYRTEKKLTQEELSEKLCVSSMSVARWEGEKVLPNPIVLEKMKKLKIIE